MDVKVPLRVLHVIFSLEGGGAENQLIYLINNMNSAVISSAVCCFDERGLTKVKKGIKTYVLHRKHKLDLCYRKVKEVYKDFQPDIIHNWLPIMLKYTVPILKFESRSKIIASFRNVYKLSSPRRLFQFPFLLLSDFIVSNVPYECLNSPYKYIYKLKGGRLIPNGFPINELRRRESISITGEKNADREFNILYVGRMVPKKNIPLLFNALKILLTRRYKCRLILAGEGFLLDKLIKLSEELHLTDHITFLGYQRDIHHIMRQSDLLVLPSFREGMSNSLFESMALGIPVAASNIPVHQYWLMHNENAVLFDPRCAVDLADQIESIINKSDLELETLLSNAGILVNGLSISKMVHKYERFYLEIIGKKEV